MSTSIGRMRWIAWATVWGMASPGWADVDLITPPGVGPGGSGTLTPQPADRPTGQLIEGIVLNFFGGGIADAVVRIESLDAGADAPPLTQGTTNEVGDINLRLPQTVTGPVRVRIQREGFVDFVTRIDPTDEEDPPFVEATLEGASKLSGKVYVATGTRPVAGARVTCTNGGRDLAATTDAQGRFTFENVFRGAARILVHADGFGTEHLHLMIESDEATADVEMSPERRVELTVVTNEGDPAGKVVVEGYTEPGQNFLNVVTDDEGRATLRGISGQTTLIRLRLSGDRYVQSGDFDEEVEMSSEQTPGTTQPATSQPAEPPPTVVQRRLVVTIAARLEGKVIDAETRGPIVGVRVIAGRDVRGNMPMTWTNEDGIYELPGLPPGNNVITFQRAGFAPRIDEVQLTRDKARKLDARLEAGEPLAGRVVDETGAPLDQVRVGAERWKGYTTLGMRVVTDEEGKFTFDHAPKGEIEVSFVRPGYGRPQTQTLETGKTDHQIKLEAETLPTREMAPQIADGQEVPDFTLTTTDGTVYKLSELRGKYVFLGFWASWCRSCIAEVPYVKGLADATKDRPDFLLIGVSLDHDRKQFEAALDKHKIAWPQVFGEQSGSEQAFNTLDGVALPYTCLIGTDGKMVAQHLRGENLAAEVTQRLAKPK